MNSASVAAAGAGLAAGGAALAVAGVLLHRTLTEILEIRRYAEEIADAGEDVRRNTDVAAELTRLRGLVAEVRAAAGGPSTVEEAG